MAAAKEGRAVTQTEATQPEATQPEATQHSRLRPEKRAAILAGAMSAMARLGYADASIDAVAREAAVSTRTIYKHFPSKAELFRTVIAESTTRIADAETVLIRDYFDQLRPGDPLGPALTELACVWMGAATGEDRTHQMILRQLAADAQHIPRSVVDAWLEAGPRRVRHELALRFRVLADRGELIVDDPDRAAVLFAQLISAQFAPGAPADLPDDEQREWIVEAVRLFLAGHLPK